MNGFVCKFFHVHREEHAVNNWRAAEPPNLQNWFKLSNWLFTWWWKCDIFSIMKKRHWPQNGGNCSRIIKTLPSLLCTDINMTLLKLCFPHLYKGHMLKRIQIYQRLKIPDFVRASYIYINIYCISVHFISYICNLL